MVKAVQWYYAYDSEEEARKQMYRETERNLLLIMATYQRRLQGWYD